MSLLAIRRFPDPILKRPTRCVQRFDTQLKRLIDAMIQTMHSHPRCVGLAAPQVGSAWRIAVMDSSRHPKTTTTSGLITLINPVIDEQKDQTVQREGCLSIPDFTANVRRATRVHNKAINQSGTPFEIGLSGLEAIIAQHEIDHLDGKLFLDSVENVKTDVFRRKTYL